MTDPAERVARLEARDEAQDRRIDELAITGKEMAEGMRELATEVGKLRQEMSSSKSFLSGIAFAFGFIGTAAGGVAAFLLNKLWASMTGNHV